VVYPSSLLPLPWRYFFALNPMVGVVEGFRWAILGTALPPGVVVVSVGVATLVLVSGVLYFRQAERTFADVV